MKLHEVVRLTQKTVEKKINWMVGVRKYLQPLTQDDWVIIAKLLQLSSQARSNHTSTWIKAEVSIFENQRIYHALVYYFGFRFKRCQDKTKRIFQEDGKSYYMIQQHNGIPKR